MLYYDHMIPILILLPCMDFIGGGGSCSDITFFMLTTDVGARNKLDLEAVPMREVEKRVQGVRDGGSWSPQDCIPRHKVAIIIPFRDRYEQLAIMLNNIHSFLQRQNLHYRIFVIEQVKHRFISQCLSIFLCNILQYRHF